MRGRTGRLVAAFVALTFATLTRTPLASAQATSDAAAAEVLFNEAQRLAAAGKYAEACPKYAESLRLDSGIGAMLYLADCWEKTGKTASAWGQFREAEQLAVRQNDKRAVAAHKRAAQLEPNLARLVIRVAPGVDVPGLDVKRDQTEVGRAQWGVPVPVDPGSHMVTATAIGKKPQQVAINVPAGATPTILDLMALQDADATAPAPVPSPAASSPPAPSPLPDTPPPAEESAAPGQTQRLVGLVVGGVGVVGLGLGTYFGFDTISKNNASNAPGNCSAATNACSQNGLDLRSSAKSSGLVSTVAFAAGAAFVAGGVVLYLTAPRSPGATTVGFTPALDGRGGAAIFSRAF